MRILADPDFAYKKALVLDLDNTLWGGIVGDDGVDGIAIGPEVPEGQVYAEFQSYCKALQPIGVVLVFGACLFAAFYRVYNKDSSAEFTAFERSYFVIGMCMLVFTVAALCMERGDLTPFAAALHSKRFVLSTLVLSVFCSVAANILVNYSASILPMAIFSNLGSLITVCAMFLGIIFLDEPTNAMSLVGSAMVLVGLFLIARVSEENSRKPKKESPQRPDRQS